MVQLKVYPFEGATQDECTFLDLYETQPIKLTLSIEDITSADATSVFSRTFRVPATRGNNDFFENAYEIDGIDFDITIKKPAEILVDGAEFRAGHVRLQKIYANGDLDKIDYELLFLGETRDFSSAIGEKRMCELTMTDFNWDGLPQNYTNANDFVGPFDYQDVTTSWIAYPNQPNLTTGYADGDMIFPLIDHGNVYDNGSVEDARIALAVPNSENPFTSSTNALSVDRMKPMIRAKRLWDQIFEDAGYTYESDFLNTDQFHQMYVSAFGNNETNVMEVGQVTDTIFSATEPDNGNNDGNDYMFCSNVTANNGNSYSVNVPSIGSYFTAPGTASISGSYYTMKIQAEVDFLRENSDYSYDPIAAAVQLVVVDSVGGNILHTLDTGNFTIGGNTSTCYYDSRAGGYQPQQGDILQVLITVVNSYDVGSVGDCLWECTAAPGNYYPLRDLDCEYNQIDFIKDVITMFRLVMQPDKDRPYHFIIEPWQDFIGSGEVYDWSHKLIREKDFVSEPLFNTQSAIIEYSMQEDEDLINTFHQDNTQHPYGWLRFDSGNELLKGKREVTVEGISPTPVDQIAHGQTNNHPDPTFIIPTIIQTDGETFNRLPIKTNTRFLFYNGKQSISDSQNYWYLNNGGVAAVQDDYPLVTSYSDWPVQQTSLNLNFYNDVRYFLQPNPGSSYFDNGSTLYDEYWSRYINSLYNKFSRRVTAYFTLNNVDLQDFTFDDLVFVDGKYYRPEKIIDAQIGERTAVKVQLITYKDQRPVWRDEALTGFSIVESAGICTGEFGSIQITTNGTPPFNWYAGDVENPLASGTYNDTPGQAPYIFTAENIPVGTDTLTVIDSQGRTAEVTYTIASSQATPVVATHTVTDATDCSSPCNGAIQVTPSGGSGSGYTITWQDPNVSGFNPTGLCPNDYLYYITDSNGCQSDTYEATVSCQVVTTKYVVREHLNNCTALSSQTYIASSTNQYQNGDTVALNERNGCYQVVGTTNLNASYTISQSYATCADCTTIVPTSYEVETCGGGSTIYVNRSQSLFPGQAVELTSTPGCFEVIGDSTQTPTEGVQQIFKNCNDCTATPPNFIYYAYFCSGVTSPRYFTSTVTLQANDVVEVSSGQYSGECVVIISQNQAGFSEGNLDTTTIYDDCSSCQGITLDTCHRIVTGASSVSISYERGGTTYTALLSANQIYNFCGQNFVETSGSWDSIQDILTICQTNFDCMEISLRTSCHTLSGGTAGSQFEYQDGGGTFQNIFVNAYAVTTVCAVINSVTRTSGNGSYQDNQSLCTDDNDCDSVGPGDPIP